MIILVLICLLVSFNGISPRSQFELIRIRSVVWTGHWRRILSFNYLPVEVKTPSDKWSVHFLKNLIKWTKQSSRCCFKSLIIFWDRIRKIDLCSGGVPAASIPISALGGARSSGVDITMFRWGVSARLKLCAIKRYACTHVNAIFVSHDQHSMYMSQGNLKFQFLLGKTKITFCFGDKIWVQVRVRTRPGLSSPSPHAWMQRE